MPTGPWWFRTVSGRLPDGRRTLSHSGVGLPANPNKTIWFSMSGSGRLGDSTKDFEFGSIYVNGGNNLENLRGPDLDLEGTPDRGGLPPADVRYGGHLMPRGRSRNAAAFAVCASPSRQ